MEKRLKPRAIYQTSHKNFRAARARFCSLWRQIIAKGRTENVGIRKKHGNLLFQHCKLVIISPQCQGQGCTPSNTAAARWNSLLLSF